MGAFKKGLLGAFGACVGIGLFAAMVTFVDEYATDHSESYREWKEKQKSSNETTEQWFVRNRGYLTKC